MSEIKIGLQLFSVKDFMEKDVEATLKAVSEMGYECVEFAGYFDKSAEEMKALCEKPSLTANWSMAWMFVNSANNGLFPWRP